MSTDDPRPAAERDLLFCRVLPAPAETASPARYLPEEAMDGEDQGLELRLSLGGGAARCKGGRDEPGRGGGAGVWGDRCRILTAGDLEFAHNAGRPAASGTHPPLAMSSPTASMASVSSSSSSSLAATGSGRRGSTAGCGGAGTKRAAEAAAPDARSSSPSGQAVVGWPPIRAYRVNNLVNHPPKDNSAKEGPGARHDNTPAQGACIGHAGCSTKGHAAQENVAAANGPEKKKTSGHLVKVNMDGMAIGRKIDLGAHSSYNALALALEDMFQTTPTPNPSQTRKISKLLDGSSEFALTYEDKDGDWMLVGDVPWGMFLNSVRRLRIMRTCDANILAPGVQPSGNGSIMHR